MEYAQVLVDVTARLSRDSFTYRVPVPLREVVAAGWRVRVPFGARDRATLGVVLGEGEPPPGLELKEILELVGSEPLLPPSLVRLAVWAAERYLASPAQFLRAMLPPQLKEGAPRGGWLLELTPGAELSDATPQEVALAAVLAARGGVMGRAQALRAAGVTPAAAGRLVRRGAARQVWGVAPPPPRSRSEDDRPVEPTPEQVAAVERIRLALERGSGRLLLHGVTGSGKTEVYLRAIAAGLALGRGALCLVPEIALTPQAEARFRARFGERVAVLHSGLSQAERYREWMRIRSGEASVVVGARSAVFAPVRNLGLLILDEEHEGSYRQEESPCYHARAVAEERSDREAAVLVLGSATPSLESYHRAMEGELELAVLPTRVPGTAPPRVEVVDMRRELARGNRSVFSEALAEGIGRCLERGEQAILFVNRRGFAGFVLCRECGHVPQCAHCAVTLTVHQAAGVLACHHCYHREPLPLACPVCGSRYLRPFGLGTERLAEEVLRRFPAARVLRMDADTTRGREGHAAVLDRFSRGEAQILVGTQMVAHGLDLPRVTLVGAVAADLSLNFPDFRAAERTFQLLAQVAGRAGRGARLGEVVIQTYQPEHYGVRSAARQDYAAFYRAELERRREAGYPPFSRLVLCEVSGSRAGAVGEAARELAGRLRAAGAPEVRGPAPALVARIRDRYRWQVLLRGPRREELVRAASGALAGWRLRGDLRVVVRVDPGSLG